MKGTKMKKIISIVAITVTLTACSGVYQPVTAPQVPKDTHAAGAYAYDYVGCRKVTANPADDGSVAFGPAGITSGGYIFMKQRTVDGKPGDLKNTTPCFGE